MANKTFVILGNQLFKPSILKQLGCDHVFMAEDFGLCTYERHHKLKIYLFLTSMREYRDELRSHGIKVSYFCLEDREPLSNYTSLLNDFINKNELKEINCFEIEDREFEKDFQKLFNSSNVQMIIHQSPMFMYTREAFTRNFGKNKTFRLANFYKSVRKDFQILVDSSSSPEGGKWSFDEENRKPIPKHVQIPGLPRPPLSKYHDNMVRIIEENFPDHPGDLDNIWFPVARKDVERQLDNFLETKLHDFGIYEDAVRQGENFLFHSCISPFLNLGLITPKEVIERTLRTYQNNSTPINSVEGFIRQILGWREFIRGIYQVRGEFQQVKNFWEHRRKLNVSWYDGSTGIIPLDDCINSAVSNGYNHHIPRLMIICNIMNLCEVDPKYIYKWFMEMYIDSSEWVMVPNVFGMATFSDGGLMSTKPYTCSSNYILKMSDYPKGTWCDTVDGLYWRFIERHKDFYRKNPRLAFQTKMLEKMSSERKVKIFGLAENFIKNHTSL